MEINKKDIYDHMYTILTDIGMPCGLMGYMYIKDAIYLMLQHENQYRHAIVRKLYTDIAELHGSTGRQVERCIRHAIYILL